MKNNIFEQLKKKALYAQRSLSRPLLCQVFGAAQMARELDAITHNEFMELNTMTIVYMNTSRELIRHENEVYRRIAWDFEMQKS